MSTQLPTRQQVENAADLDFAPRTDRQLPISITIAPDGIRVHIDYVDTIASIPAAVERLRAAGLVDLITATRIIDAAPAMRQKPAQHVEPSYKADGSPCCPVHGRTLSEGRFGLYCSAKAGTGDVANAKGYCGLKFVE